MDRNKIIDKAVEVFIALALGTSVAVLQGLRADINQLNTTMSSLVERVSNEESRIKEHEASDQDIERRLRKLEIDNPPRRGR